MKKKCKHFFFHFLSDDPDATLEVFRDLPEHNQRAATTLFQHLQRSVKLPVWGNIVMCCKCWRFKKNYLPKQQIFFSPMFRLLAVRGDGCFKSTIMCWLKFWGLQNMASILRIRPGAMKLVLCGHWMHLSYMHQWRQRSKFIAPGCM